MRTEINIGNLVLCDICNKDYTLSDARGGFFFAGKAVCPECESSFMESIKRYREERYITDKAKPDEEFREFVYRLRGHQPGMVIIESFDFDNGDNHG